MTPIRAKALAALREGRVTITIVHPSTGEITGVVDSSRNIHDPGHTVDYVHGNWTCTTTGGRSCPQPCWHVAAVQLVTGFKSAAAR